MAIRLVEKSVATSWLRDHSQVLASYCWIPDTDWKRTKSDRKRGSSSHWLNPEKIGRTVETLSLVWSENEKVSGLKGVKLHDKLGGLWWRAEQFRQTGCDSAQEWKARAQSLALLGHFIGDGSQPLHLTADYDGAAVGHPHLHSFYENTAVESYDSALWSEVEAEARKIIRSGYFDAKAPLTSKMKKMAIEVSKDREPMVSAIGEDRDRKENSAQIFKAWKSGIVHELALSAALLSQAWEECSSNLNPKSDLKNAWEDYTAHPPQFVAPSYLK